MWKVLYISSLLGNMRSVTNVMPKVIDVELPLQSLPQAELVQLNWTLTASWNKNKNIVHLQYYFDDKNYIEITVIWLNNKQVDLSRHHPPQQVLLVFLFDMYCHFVVMCTSSSAGLEHNMKE